MRRRTMPLGSDMIIQLRKNMAKKSHMLMITIAIASVLLPSVTRADLPASFFESQGSGSAGQNVASSEKPQDSLGAAVDAECAGDSCQAETLDASDDGKNDAGEVAVVQEGDKSEEATEQGGDLLAVVGALTLLLAAAAYGCLLRIRKTGDR